MKREIHPKTPLTGVPVTHFVGMVTFGIGLGQYLNMHFPVFPEQREWVIGALFASLVVCQFFLFRFSAHGLLGLSAGMLVGVIQGGAVDLREPEPHPPLSEHQHVELHIVSELKVGRPGEARFTAIISSAELAPERYHCSIRRLPWRNSGQLEKGGVYAAFVSLRASSRDRWGRYELRRSIVGRCKVRFLSQQLNGFPHAGERSLLKKLQARFRNIFRDENVRALVQGMTLGQGGGMGRELRVAFQEWGLVHLLVVSGLHVGALYLFISSALTLLVGGLVHHVGFGYRLMRYVPQAVGLCGVWGYIHLLEFSVSATRAGVGLTCFLLSQHAAKTTSFFDRIVIAAAILFALWPGVWEELGFQLTFTALFALLGAVKIVQWKGCNRIEGYCIFAFLPSLFTSLVFYLHTGVVSPFGQLGNLVFAPLYVFFGFYGGVGMLVLSCLSLTLAQASATVIELALSFTNNGLLYFSTEFAARPGVLFLETLQDEVGLFLWVVCGLFLTALLLRTQEQEGEKGLPYGKLTFAN